MTRFNLEETLKAAGWTEDSITRIYRGGDHVCRCGCAGKYFERGTAGFSRALNALRRGFATEEEGELVYVEGYGHGEMRRSEGVTRGPNWINVPDGTAANHNRCYCLYND